MGPWCDDGQACTDDATKCHGEGQGNRDVLCCKTQGDESQRGCYSEKKKDLQKEAPPTCAETAKFGETVITLAVLLSQR